MSVLPWILVGLAAAWLAGKFLPQPEKVVVPAESEKQARR
jgi:uncharacterized membrane protein YeaQ/YmgE (transglycosylase-associated protein family)